MGTHIKCSFRILPDRFFTSFLFWQCPCLYWKHEAVPPDQSGCTGCPAPPGCHIHIGGRKKVCCVSQQVSRAWRYQETNHYTKTAGQGCRRATSQQQDWHLLLCARRNRRSTARALDNDLQQAAGVHVSNHTVRNRRHDLLPNASSVNRQWLGCIYEVFML